MNYKLNCTLCYALGSAEGNLVILIFTELFRYEIVDQTYKMTSKHNERRKELSEVIGTPFSHTKTFKVSFESVDLC